MLTKEQKIRVLGYKVRKVTVRELEPVYDWVNEALGVESDNTYETIELAVEGIANHMQDGNIGWNTCPIGEYDTGVTITVFNPDVLLGE